MMACAFSQNYYTNSSSSTDNTNKKDAKEKKDSDYKVDRYNELEARRVVVGITFGPSFNWMNWSGRSTNPVCAPTVSDRWAMSPRPLPTRSIKPTYAAALPTA